MYIGLVQQLKAPDISLWESKIKINCIIFWRNKTPCYLTPRSFSAEGVFSWLVPYYYRTIERNLHTTFEQRPIITTSRSKSVLCRFPREATLLFDLLFPSSCLASGMRPQKPATKSTQTYFYMSPFHKECVFALLSSLSRSLFDCRRKTSRHPAKPKPTKQTNVSHSKPPSLPNSPLSRRLLPSPWLQRGHTL